MWNRTNDWFCLCLSFVFNYKLLRNINESVVEIVEREREKNKNKKQKQ